MKRAIKVGLGIILFTLCFFNSALATEFGFKTGLMATYTGKIEEIRTMDEEIQFDSRLEHSGLPLSIFLVHNNMRLSYLHYEQYMEKSDPNTAIGSADRIRGTALIRNDVFTIGYQYEFPPLLYDIQFFAGADLALFKSALNLETTYYDGVATQPVSSSNTVNLKSEPEISIGVAFNAGVKKYLENVFISADICYINKRINFERIPSYQEQLVVDIGGFIYSIGAGVAF